MRVTSCTTDTKRPGLPQDTAGKAGFRPFPRAAERVRRFARSALASVLLGAGGLAAQLAPGSTLEKHALPLADSAGAPERTVRVWLPPAYPRDAPYPVLVLLDGQNLFDALTAFAGEWGVDEALAARQADGRRVPVVLGVDNGGEARIHEYGTRAHPDYGGGGADAHLAWITDRVLPWARERYALSRERAEAGIGGSSLGGLVALQAGATRPEWGYILALSPAVWFDPGLLDRLPDTACGPRWYLAMGARERSADDGRVLHVGGEALDLHAGNLLEAGNRLRRAGCGPGRLTVLVDPDGQHRESYWRARFPDAVAWWLDPPPADPSPEDP